MSHQEGVSSLSYRIEPGGRLQGRLRVPGDKSISHRAVMLGALAEGTTRISGLLEGEDVLATLAAFRAMGVQAEGPRSGQLGFHGSRRGGKPVSSRWTEGPTLVIHGAGLHGLQAPRAPLDMGNSGTAMRLMAGILAGQAFDSELTGDSSLCLRPMERVATPLRAMGAKIQTAAGGRPPLRIQGGQRLRALNYALPMASAQVKSALLLAGLYAEGETCLTEPAPTRDHSERMLRGFGWAVQSNNQCIRLRGGGRLQGTAVDVPADISSAAFFLVGAAITPGSDLLLEHVGVNPTRGGILTLLKQMGVQLSLENPREVGGEPVADIRVRGGSLHGIRISPALVPLAIDEFPALFIAAALAQGETILTGAEELRVKESDRIAVMAAGLKRLGIDAQETPDGMVIQGGSLRGGEVNSHGDHRIAMAFAMAGLRAAQPIIVRDCKNVATSFPGFVSLAAQAGLNIQEVRGS